MNTETRELLYFNKRVKHWQSGKGAIVVDWTKNWIYLYYPNEEHEVNLSLPEKPEVMFIRSRHLYTIYCFCALCRHVLSFCIAPSLLVFLIVCGGMLVPQMGSRECCYGWRPRATFVADTEAEYPKAAPRTLSVYLACIANAICKDWTS